MTIEQGWDEANEHHDDPFPDNVDEQAAPEVVLPKLTPGAAALIDEILRLGRRNGVAPTAVDEEMQLWLEQDGAAFRIAEHQHAHMADLNGAIAGAYRGGNEELYLALCSLKAALHDRARLLGLLSRAELAPAGGELGAPVCALMPGGKPLGPIERAAVEGFQQYLADRKAYGRMTEYLEAWRFWGDFGPQELSDPDQPIATLPAPAGRPADSVPLHLLEPDVRRALAYLGQRLAAYEAPTSAAPGDLADVLDSLIRVFRTEDNPGKTLRQFYVTDDDERKRWLAALEQAARALGAVGMFALCEACKVRPGKMDGGLCGGCYDQAVAAELAGDFADEVPGL